MLNDVSVAGRQVDRVASNKIKLRVPKQGSVRPQATVPIELRDSQVRYLDEREGLYYYLSIRGHLETRGNTMVVVAEDVVAHGFTKAMKDALPQS